MENSYDYSVLIGDIKTELKEGLIKSSDTIQILRGETCLANSSSNGKPIEYNPIIEYYYNEEDMMEYFRYDDSIEEERLRYEEDKPHLETITVADFLKELLEMK